MHDVVYQPAAEVEGEDANEDGAYYIRIRPVYDADLLMLAPVRQLNNENGEKSVDDEVNDGEAEIHGCMIHFPLLIL